MRALVIGAGPAGAAAALELARGGARVTLAEKSAWPRIKTCGDGVSPPGVAIARDLGLALDDRFALPVGDIEAPSGARYRSGWRAETPWGTVIERRDLDARLVDLAVAAGARFTPATEVRGLVLDGRGARAELARSGKPERFDAVVLAEGATGALAAALGFPRYRSRLVALRGYLRARRPLDAAFGLFFHRLLTPGYGWIFPLSPEVANVGILVDARVAKRTNLRTLLMRWLAASDVACDLFGEVPSLAGLSGGVIPTGRSRRVRGAVFLAGDAAGTADPFTAEGISQAWGSGADAGRALAATGGDVRAAAARYRRDLRRFDRNEAEARRLRLGFGFVIDPLVARAAYRPALAHHLAANGLFMKESLPSFLAGIVRTW